MTDPRIIQLLEHISYALDHLGSIAEDIVDPHDHRLVQLQASNRAIDTLIIDLQTPEPLSPPSEPAKEATAQAGDANQAAPEFASHAVGDRVMTPMGEFGVIREISRHGEVTIVMDGGYLEHRTLKGLKNLSRQEGGAK